MSDVAVPAPDRRSIRVLIAEDHPLVRERITDILTRAGYSVVGAVTNGSDLIAAESTLHPDVLVADISMPDVNGFEAAHRIRSRGSNAVIVYVTGYTQADMLQAAWDAGAAAYVAKVSMLRDLVPAITEGLAGRRFVSAPALNP